ncbi:hypothetical protein BC832DRAFT_592669 [Gaertneriomyces semiglobifer]|nr:hypothetical protein BC832DRAFT_592669 [Gaertneriomyces semiglobifer]
MGIGSLGSFSENAMVKFKGRQCQLSVSGSVDAGPGDCGVLTVQLEDVENGYKWAGVFSAAGIEEITTKTGNFKRFTVFVEMLLSSLSKSSQTVHLDFLTIDDLRNMANDHAQKSSGSNQKVYLVLTYAVAFDRVHYPLPMNLETSDSPDGGATAWTQNMPMHSVDPLKRMEEISNLLRENDRLKYELKIATSQASSVQSSTRHFNEHRELETLKNLQYLAQDAVKAAKREYKRFFDRNSALRHSPSAIRLADHLSKLEKILGSLKELSSPIQPRSELMDSSFSSAPMPVRMRHAPPRSRPRSKDLQHTRAPSTRNRSRNQADSYVPVKSRPLSRDVWSSSGGREGRSSRNRNNSPSPFRRFDPTEYVKERNRKLDERRARSRSAESRTSSVGSSRSALLKGSASGSVYASRNPSPLMVLKS